jgi:putative flippase GtrA
VLLRHGQIVKYLFSGGTATIVDLGILYVLTDVVGFHYLTSAILAFVCAFGVSFVLQKYWTFGNAETDGVHRQLSIFFIVAVVNLILNTLLMKLFVDVWEVWYMTSQIIITALIACMSFFIYRHLVFPVKKIVVPRL